MNFGSSRGMVRLVLCLSAISTYIFFQILHSSKSRERLNYFQNQKHRKFEENISKIAELHDEIFTKLIIHVGNDVSRARAIAMKNLPNLTKDVIFFTDQSSLPILDGRNRSPGSYFKSVHELNLTTLIYNWVNFTEVFQGNKGLLLMYDRFYAWSLWAPRGVAWSLHTGESTFSNLQDAFENNLNITEKEKISRFEHAWSEDVPLYFPFHSDILKNWPNVFIHIINSVAISHDGGIRTQKMKLIPYMCRQPSFVQTGSSVIHLEEVFVLNQFWGIEFYHWMNEDLPRLAFFLPFLLEHPHIKIHVMTVNSIVINSAKILGLDASRFVSGDVTARLAYVPGGGGCGFTFPLQGRVMRLYYHRYIKGKLLGPAFTHNNIEVSSEGNGRTRSSSRNMVVIIKRSTKRWLEQHDEVYNISRALCVKFGCEVIVFNYENRPSIEETMLVFYRAIVIIAPHGAGLSNMVYSQQGTIVIEALGSVANMCFQAQAVSLGIRYHGIIPNKYNDGRIVIDLDHYTYVLGYFLNQILNIQKI